MVIVALVLWIAAEEAIATLARLVGAEEMRLTSSDAVHVAVPNGMAKIYNANRSISDQFIAGMFLNCSQPCIFLSHSTA
jgi:hypothetical protein